MYLIAAIFGAFIGGRTAKKRINNFLKFIEMLALIGDTGEDYILTVARCLN